MLSCFNVSKILPGYLLIWMGNVHGCVLYAHKVACDFDINLLS